MADSDGGTVREYGKGSILAKPQRITVASAPAIQWSFTGGSQPLGSGARPARA
jgi:hypothetical protein